MCIINKQHNLSVNQIYVTGKFRKQHLIGDCELTQNCLCSILCRCSGQCDSYKGVCWYFQKYFMCILELEFKLSTHGFVIFVDRYRGGD